MWSTVPASHVHQLQPGKQDQVDRWQLWHQWGGRTATYHQDERGDQAALGGPWTSELRQECWMEAGRRSLGHWGTLLRSHQRSLPSLPHPGGNSASWLEVGLVSWHFRQEPWCQREGVLVGGKAWGHAHLVLPLWRHNEEDHVSIGKIFFNFIAINLRHK